MRLLCLCLRAYHQSCSYMKSEHEFNYIKSILDTIYVYQAEDLIVGGMFLPSVNRIKVKITNILLVK